MKITNNALKTYTQVNKNKTNKRYQLFSDYLKLNMQAFQYLQNWRAFLRQLSHRSTHKTCTCHPWG